MISPPDDLILSIPPAYLKRPVARGRLADCDTLSYPRFIKPPVPKLFQAGIYPSPDALREECRGLDADTQILTSEIVQLEAETRFFIRSGAIAAGAVHEGDAPLAGAAALVEALLSEVEMPRTVVVDAGRLEGGDWCVIEFNATWGAGLNGCAVDKIVECIEESAETGDSNQGGGSENHEWHKLFDSLGEATPTRGFLKKLRNLLVIVYS